MVGDGCGMSNYAWIEHTYILLTKAELIKYTKVIQVNPSKSIF